MSNASLGSRLSITFYEVQREKCIDRTKGGSNFSSLGMISHFKLHSTDAQNSGCIDFVFWRTEQHQEIIKENLIQRNVTIKDWAAAIFTAENRLMFWDGDGKSSSFQQPATSRVRDLWRSWRSPGRQPGDRRKCVLSQLAAIHLGPIRTFIQQFLLNKFDCFTSSLIINWTLLHFFK